MKNTRKLTRKIVALFMAIAMIPPISALAIEANETQVANSALAQVTALYSDVYVISDTSAVVLDQESDGNGNTVYIVETSFKRTLKETDATKIPAIQGMIREMEQLEDPAAIQAAQEYIAARVADMNNNYIGVAQDTNVTLRVTLPTIAPFTTSTAQLVTSSTIEVECGLGEEEYGPLIGIAPRSAAVQLAAGREIVAEVAAEKSGMSLMSVNDTPHNAKMLNYNRVAARNYAREWSCDLGIAYDHATCHNPSYSFFEDEDCTNFVSQCMVAGGLTTDNTWYPYSPAWNTTGNSGNGIRQYIVNNDMFFQTTNVNKAFAGSIINQLNSSGGNAGHVGLIDQNDFYTVTFCAHTNCRSSKPVSFITYKDYYVPYYDYHGGVWVEP